MWWGLRARDGQKQDFQPCFIPKSLHFSLLYAIAHLDILTAQQWVYDFTWVSIYMSPYNLLSKASTALIPNSDWIT